MIRTDYLYFLSYYGPRLYSSDPKVEGRNGRAFFFFVSSVLLVMILSSQSAFTEEVKERNENKVLAESAMTPSLPEKIDFAGEPVPMGRREVRERLDRELLFNFYNTPNVLYTMKMANRYFREISERLMLIRDKIPG